MNTRQDSGWLPLQVRGRCERREAGTLAVVIPSAGFARPDGEPLLAEALRLVGDQAPIHVVVTNGQMSPRGIALCASKGVTVVGTDSPGGFNYSRAVNAGVRATQADRILLLNDDVCGPARSGWLEWWLAQPAELSSVALRWPNGRTAYTGIKWGGPGELPSHARVGRPAALVPRRPRTLALSAAAMLVDRPLFDRLGGFCEELPLNYNDVDFCLRALAQGATPCQYNRIVLTHWEQASRGASTADFREMKTFEARCAAILKPYGVRVSAERAIAEAPWRSHASRAPGTRLRNEATS